MSDPLTGSSQSYPFEKQPPLVGVKQASQPGWRIILSAILNPGGLLQSQLKGISWPVTLLIPGLAFTLLFFQTSLDQARVGISGWGWALIMALIGCVYGTIGVLLISLVGWIGLKVLGGKTSPGGVISAFSLDYSPTLIYLVLGLVANLLFGWRTAVAFGVTGVLWALGPIMSTLRQMTGGKTVASAILGTVCGSLLLLGWSLARGR